MKKCKGTGKAKGFGCNKPLPYTERNGLKTYRAKYGLGFDCNCYQNWIISDDPNAKEVFNKSLIKGRKDYEKKIKSDWVELKNKYKENTEKKSAIEEKLQKPINKIARLIDRGHKCLSSGTPLGMNISKYDGGHLASVKSNATLRFNLFNIYGQSVHDNQHLGGNEFAYFIGIGETFGSDLQEFIKSMIKCPPLHLTKHELKEKIPIALSIVKWLQLQDRVFTIEERILLRNDFNNMLAIYPQEFCEFKNKKNE